MCAEGDRKTSKLKNETKNKLKKKMKIHMTEHCSVNSLIPFKELFQTESSMHLKDKLTEKTKKQQLNYEISVKNFCCFSKHDAHSPKTVLLNIHFDHY